MNEKSPRRPTRGKRPIASAHKDHLTKNHPNESKTIQGFLIVLGRGGGVVKAEGYPDGIRIFEENMNMALSGDEVLVKVIGKTRENETKGAITEVLERAKTAFTGTLFLRNGIYYMKPADPKMYTPLQIPESDLGGAKEGQRVYAELGEWKNMQTPPLGKITKILGVPGEHETEMEAIALERGFSEDFPDAVIEEAQMLEKRGIRAEDIAGRRDFRKITTFTIDPYDAKDFDDAISVERLENGDIEIGVHIADVSHYVQPKTPLDTEALSRGTSVYLVDRTIPMLPHALSDDLCSLVPNQDRLTMSAVITFSKDHEEKSAWFGPTVIHSAQRFTYEEAQEVLDGKLETLKDEVHLAAAIARKLGAGRVASGALVLEQEEVKVLIDAAGTPTSVVKKMRTESHTLIEELMLLANRRVAEFLQRGGAPTTPARVQATPPQAGGEHASGYAAIYRVHNEPNPEKTDDLGFFMRSIGYPIPVSKTGSVDPKSLQNVLKKIPEGDLKQTALTFIIRSMAKAVYSTKNIGHYGLQFRDYTHFTSPIRRYPDLVVHRLVREALAGHPAPATMRKFYERIAQRTSMSEVKAADAERESVKFKLTQYMAARIGQELEGTITGVTEWGMYVRDKATTAEGLVGLRSLGSESFRLDPRAATLTGEITKRQFRIGDTIRVKIVAANPEKRQIDYEVVASDVSKTENKI